MNMMTILEHVRAIVMAEIQIRQIEVSDNGVSMVLDTQSGIVAEQLIHLKFSPLPSYTGDQTTGQPLFCTASSIKVGLIGQWRVRGTTEDHDAAWFALMANRAAPYTYWFKGHPAWGTV
jgi:hypothetical protein